MYGCHDNFILLWLRYDYPIGNFCDKLEDYVTNFIYVYIPPFSWQCTTEGHWPEVVYTKQRQRQNKVACTELHNHVNHTQLHSEPWGCQRSDLPHLTVWLALLHDPTCSLDRSRCSEFLEVMYAIESKPSCHNWPGPCNSPLLLTETWTNKKAWEWAVC